MTDERLCIFAYGPGGVRTVTEYIGSQYLYAVGLAHFDHDVLVIVKTCTVPRDGTFNEAKEMYDRLLAQTVKERLVQ